VVGDDVVEKVKIKRRGVLKGGVGEVESRPERIVGGRQYGGIVLHQKLSDGTSLRESGDNSVEGEKMVRKRFGPDEISLFSTRPPQDPQKTRSDFRCVEES